MKGLNAMPELVDRVEPERNPYAPRGSAGSASKQPSHWAAKAVKVVVDPIHKGPYHSLEPINGIGGTNICGPYEPVIAWPKAAHPGEWRTGSGRSVYAESPNRVY